MYEILRKLFYFLEYLEYRQTHFAGCFLQKIKTWKNFKFFYQNHGLTPLAKSQFFDFFNFLILRSKNVFFLSGIIIMKHILLVDFAKNKNVEKSFDQNHGLTPLEKYQNFNFFNFVILESKNAIFLSTITTKTFSRPIYPTIKR